MASSFDRAQAAYDAMQPDDNATCECGKREKPHKGAWRCQFCQESLICSDCSQDLDNKSVCSYCSDSKQDDKE